jgi:hypothetical protein
VLANPRSSNRVLCYCADCQAFAHFLGDAQRVLDARGGSDVIQVLPKNVAFTQGLDALACMRLRPKGLLRWYARCCRTPIGNTLPTPKLSFIGLVHSCLAGDGVSLDESCGPVGVWVNTQGAKGDPKPKAAGSGKMIRWFLRTALRARFNGDYRRNPLFHPETGAPIVTPQALSSDEWSRLMQAVRAAGGPK